MPFVVDRKKLAKVLSNITQASRGIQYKAVMGRTQGTSLTTWYDSLEGHLWQFMENEETTAEELTFSVSIANVHKLVSAWKSKTITLSQGENQSLVLTSGNSKVTVPYYDDGVSLDVPSEPVGTYIGMIPEEFLVDIEDSINFIGQMSNRPELACIELKVADKGLVVNSTDSFFAYHSSHQNLQIPMSAVRFNERVIKTMTSVFAKQSIQLYSMEDDSVILKGENAILQMVPIRVAYPELEKLIVDVEVEPLMKLNTKKALEVIKLAEAVSKGTYMTLRPPSADNQDEGVNVGLADITMEADLKIEDSGFMGKDFSYLPVDANKFKECLQVFNDDEYVMLEKMNNGYVRFTGSGDGNQFTCLAPLST